MTQLGNGLYDAKHHEDALSVRQVELSTRRRFGASEDAILCAQANLANQYDMLGRNEEALELRRDVYFGFLKLDGKEKERTLTMAINYAKSLRDLKRFEDAKALMCKTIPVARRVFGKDHRLTLKMRWGYAQSLYKDTGATLDDLREAVTDIGAMQRLIDERMVSMPRNATPEQQYLAFQLIPPTREFVSILAARGLPPDWTEEELERQGYDLWATRPEDVIRARRRCRTHGGATGVAWRQLCGPSWKAPFPSQVSSVG